MAPAALGGSMAEFPEDEFGLVEIDFDRVVVNAPYRRRVVERLRRARIQAERQRRVAAASRVESTAEPD
jgi:hypothetical protein